MSALARRILISFAVLGLAASVAATWVHYHLIKNPDYASFCDVNTTVSCKQAYLSAYGSIAGVPVAVLGLLFFMLVLLLVWAGRHKPAREGSAATGILVLSALGLVMVVYLAFASFFILKEVCPLCVATYVAVIGIFAVSVAAKPPMSQLLSGLIADVRALVSGASATVVTTLFVIVAVMLLAVFPRPEQRPYVPPLRPLPDDQRVELERWFDLQPKVQLPFPQDQAKVVIVKFNDYQCPPCRGTYFAYEPVVAKYKDRPQDVKFILKHFPLNPKCNPGITNTAHPAACDAAAAAVMAQSVGTFDKLTDWFFMHQNDLTPATVRSAADDVGGIKDFEARYSQAIEQVKADAAAGVKLGVESTPTFFINGRKSPGLSADALDTLIELELRRASRQP
jgi:uncharacterized membrane protein/protein-disulfide isomerase